MAESVYSDSGDVFATPAASMFLRSDDGAMQAVPSTSAAVPARGNGLQPRQAGMMTREAGRDDSDNWTSSSGETSSLIQRKTVRKHFVASTLTPRLSKRGAIVGNSTTPTRRRKDSSSNQTTPRASRDGRTTPTGRQRNRDVRELREPERPARRKSSGNNLLAALRPLRILANMLLTLLGLAISPITSAISSFVLLVLILASLFYLVQSPLRAIATILVPSSLLSITRPFVSPIAVLHPVNLKAAYCSTIGIGCEVEPLPVARLARTVADQALQAHDIFTSVTALGNPANLGLHHTE